jgi:ribosomal protein L32
MEKGKVTSRFFSLIKVITLVLCAVMLFSTQIAPLSAQLNPARDLTGTWQSSASGTYYDMDPSDSSTRMNDIIATFTMEITQQGSQIDIILSSNILSYHTDTAYYNEYGFDGVPEAGGMSIEFVGTVSSSSFSADEQGSSLTQEHLSGTFTSDIITATLTGTSETSDTNGIIVTRTSSPTSEPTGAPTQAPTSAPSTQPTNRYYGNIGSVNGPATIRNANGDESASPGQIYSGTEILTGSNAIVSFNPPNQGGTVYLGANSEAGWVALTSQPAPDDQIAYSIYPSQDSVVTADHQDFIDMLIAAPLDATIAVAVFGATWPEATAVALVVEGGVFMMHGGSAYIKETVSHLLGVPQGALAGLNTEYAVNVLPSGSTIVQVISGPVVFMDPTTNNTIQIQTNQQLTLPPEQQNGFSQQDLQSYVSGFNSASTDQWWTQATNTSSFGALSQPIILVALLVAIALASSVAAVAVTKRRRKTQNQLLPPPPPTINRRIHKKSAQASQQTGNAPSEHPFCPNCGKQVPPAKRFCPYCGFDRQQ